MAQINKGVFGWIKLNVGQCFECQIERSKHELIIFFLTITGGVTPYWSHILEKKSCCQVQIQDTS